MLCKKRVLNTLLGVFIALLVGCSSSGPQWTVKPGGNPMGIKLSADGSLLAVSFEDGKVNLLNAADGSFSQTLVGGPKKPHRVVFSKDGQWLASASRKSRRASWWKTQDGARIATVEAGEAGVKSKVVRSESIRFVDIETGKTYGSISHVGGKSASRISGLAFLGSEALVTADNRGQVQFWDNKGEVARVLGIKGRVSSAYLSPSSGSLAVSGNNRLTLLTLPLGEKLFTLRANGPFERVVYSADGDHLATSAFGKTKVLALKSKTKLGELEGSSRALAFSKSGRHLVAAHRKSVEVWDTYQKATTGSIKVRDVKDVEIVDHEGQRILTRRKRKIELWQMNDSPKPVWTLEKPTKRWAVLPDRSAVIVELKDGTLERWAIPRPK